MAAAFNPGEEESLYWQGRLESALQACESRLKTDPAPGLAVRLMVVQGMALFDRGEVTKSLDVLARAVALAENSDMSLLLAARVALFSRLSQFDTPPSTVALLTGVRQLAFATGTAAAIGNLHLLVARLEAIRGLCIDARRHLELARRLLADCNPVSRSAIHQVDSGLEMYAGNLERARQAAYAGLEVTQSHNLQPILAGCLTNLGLLTLVSGRHDTARTLLKRAVDVCTELPVIKFSAIDSLAQLSLAEGQLSATAGLFAANDDVRSLHNLPARSWYDFAHQITRCSYHERLGDWQAILDIVDASEPEASRRQYRSVATALHCARARALAHLGRHGEAEETLAAAVRACPKSAVDPLIVLEASKGLCRTLRGDVAAGGMHFDRATAGCEAIGHRYHQQWISGIRERAAARNTVSLHRRVDLDTTDAALVLNDVSTILGAGHSIDLMAHRLISVIESTALRSRITVERQSDCEYQSEPSATWGTTPDGEAEIQLRGSDRQIRVRVSQVRTIEEFSFLKSLADIVLAGVTRTTETEHDDGDQNLWPLAAAATSDHVVLQSPRMVELLKIAMKLADTDLPVLITGETGTGKEVFAKLIHDNSRHRRGPFVPFNCATVPRDLVESQLFGHRRGAFTGANESFTGLIRSAERGTLFLDEVGDLELSAQPKLLRFLERGEVHPLGELRPQHVSVRLVAATNANIEQLAREGRFRQDLLYRLCGAALALPPVRERKDEIPALASFFLAKSAAACGRTGVRLGDDFVAALLLYDWPGNIRELSNEIRRAVALADDGAVLGARHLAPEIARLWHARSGTEPQTTAPGIHVRLDQTLAQAVSELEEQFIAHAMQSCGGRVADAAQLLGLSRKGLFLKRRRRGLVRGRDVDAQEA